MSMMQFRLSTSLALLSLALPAAAQTLKDDWFFEKGRIRVLILTGRNNHDWRATTPHLRRILDATSRFDVRIVEESSSLSAETLRPYHVLVSNYCGPRWEPQAEKAVQEFVRRGGGLVAVHAASYPFGETAVLTGNMGRSEVFQKPWPEWEKMIGARWRDDDPAKGIKRTGHSRRHVYEVKWTAAAHPVAAGLPASFTVSDELYAGFVFGEGNHVLATAWDDPREGGTGKDEPLIWTRDYGRGRVFHTALGHDVPAMRAQGFIDTFARGVEWAATQKVTIPPQLALDPKAEDAVRVLLVTGGHDHETSFYGMFEGNPKLRVNVDPHPVAFRNDIRKRYDVLVLYDSIPDLSEAQKKNLRDFVESGKGLVVLHHSLVDLPGWQWWWKEVVGGLYDLKKSTYKHDVDLKMVPVAGHPITKGLPPMWMRDETYRNVWQHPEIVPLLRTVHETSDEVIGWVSPYKASRVVVLQPGHGREAHENPWFRELVERSVLWSATSLPPERRTPAQAPPSAPRPATVR